MIVSEDEAPHLDAVRHTVLAGFTFLHLRGADGSAVAVIHAVRLGHGAVDTYTFRCMTEAVAERYRDEDYHRPASQPLWHTAGTVAEVVRELLALPPHGAPGAPVLALRRTGELWVPGCGL